MMLEQHKKQPKIEVVFERGGEEMGQNTPRGVNNLPPDFLRNNTGKENHSTGDHLCQHTVTIKSKNIAGEMREKVLGRRRWCQRETDSRRTSEAHERVCYKPPSQA